ncbi:hypothetical protein NBRC116594_02190 [Shimia sp. NS0008-38b]|uniref:class I SAM-dependent methyltransferase n=1 Tax=Shimia sp. NS0008-38b TaxID=3127653 RepID=UPI00310A4618
MDAPFEPARFDAEVAHYVAARTQYAPDLINWIAHDTQTLGRCVLDLGCGPGFIAHAIAPMAADVLGLDPSPNMIAAARLKAAPNTRFEVGSSEELSKVDAPVQLVTIGRAFHWMNRPQTLRDLDVLVARNGAIALLNDGPTDIPTNTWWKEVNAVAKSFAVIDAFNAHRMSHNWVPHEEVLFASAFSKMRSVSVYKTHQWTFERLIQHTLSRSATTEALIGDRLEEMEAKTRDVLMPYGPGPWTTLNRHTALIAQRPV